VCCIDEFDKLKQPEILLESMAQETISITKCGIKVNLPSSVTIIAAANSKGSFYDISKSLKENVAISEPFSRFDLIFTLSSLCDNVLESHIIKKPRLNSYQETVGFMTPDEMRFYIGYARENVIPKLSAEARGKILRFFTQLRQLSVETKAQKVTYRQLEGLMRMTLARARADLAEVASKKHAVDVINIFKLTMPDIFADDEFNEATGKVNTSRNKKALMSSMSKPKQQKAFLEHLQALDQTDFSSVELKDIAKELRIKDFHEIIAKLNYVGELLKSTKGY
jgi:DNA replicative helicase MCM subunit Mcm2 (Cdc46/Mcm family)